TTANDVINKYLVAIGGADKINSIKDFMYTAAGNVQGQDITFKREYKAPDKLLINITVPAMNMTVQKLVVNGDNVSMSNMGNNQDIDESEKKRYKEDLNVVPETNFSKNGYTLQLAP